jgi:hypothetical protein
VSNQSSTVRSKDPGNGHVKRHLHIITTASSIKEPVCTLFCSFIAFYTDSRSPLFIGRLRAAMLIAYSPILHRGEIHAKIALLDGYKVCNTLCLGNKADNRATLHLPHHSCEVAAIWTSNGISGPAWILLTALPILTSGEISVRACHLGSIATAQTLALVQHTGRQFDLPFCKQNF